MNMKSTSFQRGEDVLFMWLFTKMRNTVRSKCLSMKIQIPLKDIINCRPFFKDMCFFRRDNPR